MKKFLSLLLTLCLAFSAIACSAAEGTREFTDSCGRAVVLPETIRKVAVSGPMAQYVVFAIAPEMMVGVSSDWPEAAQDLLDPAYLNLPDVGQLYGTKGELNPEQVLLLSPDVVIDVGEAKSTIVEDLDQLTEQLGIPFVHIEATVPTMPEAFEKLGELLGKENAAREIGDFYASAYAKASAAAEKADKVAALYALGEEGLNVIAKGSYHAGVMDMMTENQAVVESPSSKGTGNEVDMEQLMLWDPEVIVFASGSVYDTVGENAVWQNLRAISSGKYVEAPYHIQNWMGNPPSCQCVMGMLWLGKLLYPEYAEYDLYQEISEYYRLFYHAELTEEMFNAITADSFFR